MKHWHRRSDGRIFWWTLCILLGAVAVHVSRQTRLYEATGVLEIPRPKITVVGNHEVVDAEIRSEYEVNTVLEVVASKAMMLRVLDRLTVGDRDTFFGLHGISDPSAESFQRLIQANRTLSLDKAAFAIRMSLRHPDRHMATRIVKLFLNECVAYEARVRGDETKAALEALERRAEAAKHQAAEMERVSVDYRNNHSDLNGAALAGDESYQALLKKAAVEKNLSEMILIRLAEARKEDGGVATGWRISKPPLTPGEDDYLIMPLVVTALWGTGIAVVGGVLSAIMFTRRPPVVAQTKAL